MTPLQRRMNKLMRQYERYQHKADSMAKSGIDPKPCLRRLARIADEWLKLDMIRATAGKEHER